MAADLAARRFSVTLYNRTAENIQEIIDHPTIDLDLDAPSTIWGWEV